MMYSFVNLPEKNEQISKLKRKKKNISDLAVKMKEKNLD